MKLLIRDQNYDQKNKHQQAPNLFLYVFLTNEISMTFVVYIPRNCYLESYHINIVIPHITSITVSDCKTVRKSDK